MSGENEGTAQIMPRERARLEPSGDLLGPASSRPLITPFRPLAKLVKSVKIGGSQGLGMISRHLVIDV